MRPLLPSVLALVLVACGPSRGPRADGGGGGEDLGGAPDLAMPAGPDLAMVNPGAPVHVVITADNAYAFGWGDAGQVAKLFGRPTTNVAGDIFNCPIGVGPEEYDVAAADAPDSAYLYVVAWADLSTTQGVIGEFIRGPNTVYTGDANWQVCATGQFYDSSSPSTASGPTQQVVNDEIARCNAGTGAKTTTSAGWVSTTGAVTTGAVGKLVVGQDNSQPDPRPAQPFPQVCVMDGTKRGVDTAAHWMWYSPDGTDPFHATGANDTRTFLIFRLPSAAIPIP